LPRAVPLAGRGLDGDSHDDEVPPPPVDLDQPAPRGEKDGLWQISRKLEDFGYRLRNRRLLGRAAVIAAVLAVAGGVPYLLLRSERPAATPPVVAIAAPQAKAGSVVTGGQKKLSQDRVGEKPDTDKTRPVTPIDDKVAGPRRDPSAKPLVTGKPAFGDGKPERPRDPQIAALSLLTKLGYYSPPDADEGGVAALQRAFTTWLFHHNLPSDTPLTDKLIDRMEADLTAGDIRSAGPPQPTRYDLDAAGNTP
jgi:hypothetical protein